MVNLLFISNNIKIHTIKNLLQPLLKVKIDAVSDFDLGLKEVFEKRPATVFIQDQIDGVSGESVARHIQMLLGASSPSFIFMYEGTTRVKPIKGLFEYLIDLSQTEIKIVEDIQATLKSLLGQQWEKIYIPPLSDKTANRDTIPLTEGSRVVADQLLDEFHSDLDDLGSTTVENKQRPTDAFEPLVSQDDSFQVVSSPHDQLAELLSENFRKEPTRVENTVIIESDNTITSTKLNYISKNSQTNVTRGESNTETSQLQPSAIESLTVVPGPPVSPEDFVIVAERPNEDVAPGDLLRAFEENSHLKILGRNRYVSIIVILVICMIAIVVYLFMQTNLFQQLIPQNTVKSSVIVPAVRPSETAPFSAYKPVIPPAQKSVTLLLPSFIPQAGVDRSFSSKKPGWERYVDPVAEYRVYRVSGKIKALQVLAVNNKEVSEPKMKSILIELLGDGDYLIKSHVKKDGYDIIQATVGHKADLLMYQKAKFLQAFVVSLN